MVLEDTLFEQNALLMLNVIQTIKFFCCIQRMHSIPWLLVTKDENSPIASTSSAPCSSAASKHSGYKKILYETPKNGGPCVLWKYSIRDRIDSEPSFRENMFIPFKFHLIPSFALLSRYMFCRCMNIRHCVE